MADDISGPVTIPALRNVIATRELLIRAARKLAAAELLALATDDAEAATATIGEAVKQLCHAAHVYHTSGGRR